MSARRRRSTQAATCMWSPATELGRRYQLRPERSQAQSVAALARLVHARQLAGNQRCGLETGVLRGFADYPERPTWCRAAKRASCTCWTPPTWATWWRAIRRSPKSSNRPPAITSTALRCFGAGPRDARLRVARDRFPQGLRLRRAVPQHQPGEPIDLSVSARHARRSPFIVCERERERAPGSFGPRCRCRRTRTPSSVPGVLRAFDATDLTKELWNSENKCPDEIGTYAKFVAAHRGKREGVSADVLEPTAGVWAAEHPALCQSGLSRQRQLRQQQCRSHRGGHARLGQVAQLCAQGERGGPRSAISL